MSSLGKAGECHSFGSRSVFRQPVYLDGLAKDGGYDIILNKVGVQLHKVCHAAGVCVVLNQALTDLEKLGKVKSRSFALIRKEKTR